MKRTITFLMLALLTIGGAIASPVSSQKARQTAESFWQTQGLKGSLAEKETGFANIYMYVGSEGGFVVVSGNDVARPVLAWSADAAVGDTLHAAVRYWLDGYDRQIAYVASLGAQTSPEWRSPKNGDPVTTVGPLMTTQWDQGTYYNNLCPVIGGQRCPTGCVATATAQVMKYHNWPTTGSGSHSYTNYFGTLSADFGATTYDWNQMPDELTASSTAAQKEAVAQLMYHIGVAVEMIYGTNGSAASGASYGLYDVCSENALKQYFGYSNNVRSLSRSAYSQAEWVDIIEHEIDSLRPVIYSGNSISSGHEFCVDGYDSHDRLHINWGWGGLADGYFFCDVLNPMTSGTGGNNENEYNMFQTAIVGIEPGPATQAPETQYTVQLQRNNNSWGSVSGGGAYTVGTYATLSAYGYSGYRFDHWSDGVKWSYRRLPVMGNMNLTVVFVPVSGSDTLQLDNGAYIPDSDFDSASVEFPASTMAGRQQLTGVMYFPLDTGLYTIKVTYGGGQTYTQSESVTSPGIWKTMYLNDTIPLSTQHGITITQYSPGVAYMGDGYAIRGICDGLFRPYRLEVLSNKISNGYTTGSGYYTGNPATVVITAIPISSDNQFLYWSDGDTTNPRTVEITSDTTFTAIFRGQYSFYINAFPNDTALGTVSDFNGWHEPLECLIGVWTSGCYQVQAMPKPSSRFVRWNLPSEPDFYYGGAIRKDLIGVFEAVIDTINFEAVFAPVHRNDTLVYCNYPDENLTHYYPVVSDTTTHYRWGVKYDPTVLAGCSQISAVEAYLRDNLAADAQQLLLATYTVQVYQGGEESPQTLLRTQTVSSTGHGAQWQRVTFTTPVEIDSTQPVWVVLSSTFNAHAHYDLQEADRYWTPLSSGSYCGNPNSNYIWTPETGWTHCTLRHTTYNQYFDTTVGHHENRATWLIRAFTGAPPAQMYNVTAYSDNPVMGSVSGQGTYAAGTTATLTATPNSGYRFQQWQWITMNPLNSGYLTDNPVSFTVTKDIHYNAYFVCEVTLDLLCNNNAWGTVSGGGAYAEGETVYIQATPNNGYRFVRWSDNNTSAGRYVTLYNNLTLTAYFEASQRYSVVLHRNNVEWGSVSGGGTYDAGTVVTIKASPYGGYHFVRWSNDITDEQFQLTVNSNVDLTAYFAENVGIDEVADDGIAVYSLGDRIVVEGNGDEVRVFDIVGRQLFEYEIRDSRVEIRKSKFPVSGVYIVKIDNLPAKKVVIVK